MKDINAKNVLQHTLSLDGLSEAEVFQILGKPRRNPVDKVGASKEECSLVPNYLVYPVDWTKVDIHRITPKPCLIDLDQSFRTSSPPNDLGTPRPYRSPELMLDKKAGVGSDLWALACTLFGIRTGGPLFQSYDNADDDYLDEIVMALGVLPEPWWSTTWAVRKEWYKDEGEVHERAVLYEEEAGRARSLLDKLAWGVSYSDSGFPKEKQHRDIPQREMEVFADFLGRMLRYKPEERMSAEEALSHEWFTM